MPKTWLDWFSLAANVLQFGSVIFAVVVFLKARAELASYLRSRKTSASARPWALAVTVGSGDISGTVEQHLKDQGLDLKVEPVVHEAYLTPEDYPALLKQLLEVKDKLTRVGITELHLFYKGPVALAMAVGAITDNWVPVKVYEYTQGTYRLTTVLEKEGVKGLLREAVAEGASLLTGA